MKQPSLSLVIPTCERPEELRVCLRAIESDIESCKNVEVLILDDGEDGKTEKMIILDFPWATWHRGPREGPAANRNREERALPEGRGSPHRRRLRSPARLFLRLSTKEAIASKFLPECSSCVCGTHLQERKPLVAALGGSP